MKEHILCLLHCCLCLEGSATFHKSLNDPGILVQRVMLMDEISTGLDSATTYSVVKFLCNTTHVMGLTTMIGLLQPPPEVYAVFDDVLLLTDG